MGASDPADSERTKGTLTAEFSWFGGDEVSELETSIKEHTVRKQQEERKKGHIHGQRGKERAGERGLKCRDVSPDSQRHVAFSSRSPASVAMWPSARHRTHPSPCPGHPGEEQEEQAQVLLGRSGRSEENAVCLYFWW